MTDIQSEVLEVLTEVLPVIPVEAQNYLLGYGEGLAMAISKKNENKDEIQEKAS